MDEYAGEVNDATGGAGAAGVAAGAAAVAATGWSIWEIDRYRPGRPSGPLTAIGERLANSLGLSGPDSALTAGNKPCH